MVYTGEEGTEGKETKRRHGREKMRQGATAERFLAGPLEADLAPSRNAQMK